MAQVHELLKDSQVPNPVFRPKKSNYHGPASCQGDNQSGWITNKELEPILSEYERIDPSPPGFTRPARDADGWIVYNTPTKITDRVDPKYIRIAKYRAAPNDISNKPPRCVYTHQPTRPRDPNKPDSLYCFEGGTGGIHDGTGRRALALRNGKDGATI